MKYTSLNQYTRERFGEKLYKVALDGGMTCPNRDGTLGTEGCIFCSLSGSGDFAGDRRLSITEQLNMGIEKIRRKSKASHFIAYFQAFTNTYAPVARLRALFTEAISHPDVAVLSIATRPDCLPDDVLELLAELNHIKPVWVELGLQTIHPETAKLIQRGYPLTVYDTAVCELRKRNIDVIVHVILGLPGESTQQMLETVSYVCSGPIQGIKLQLLHVLKDTKLAQMYEAGDYIPMSMDNYLALLTQCIKEIPPSVVIHRLTGDGPKSLLLAPLWSADKKRVLNAINKQLS
jgi:hypothetical protein